LPSRPLDTLATSERRRRLALRRFEVPKPPPNVRRLMGKEANPETGKLATVSFGSVRGSIADARDGSSSIHQPLRPSHFSFLAIQE
jgi:hypothetical protein